MFGIFENSRSIAVRQLFDRRSIAVFDSGCNRSITGRRSIDVRKPFDSIDSIDMFDSTIISSAHHGCNV